MRCTHCDVLAKRIDELEKELVNRAHEDRHMEQQDALIAKQEITLKEKQAVIDHVCASFICIECPLHVDHICLDDLPKEK